MTEEKQEKEKPQKAADEKPAGVSVKASPLLMQCRYRVLPIGMLSKADFRELKGGGAISITKSAFDKHGKFFIEVK